MGSELRLDLYMTDLKKSGQFSLNKKNMLNMLNKYKNDKNKVFKYLAYFKLPQIIWFQNFIAYIL